MDGGKRTWKKCVDDTVESVTQFNHQTRSLWTKAEIEKLREMILYRWFIPGGRYLYYSNKQKEIKKLLKLNFYYYANIRNRL